jgi:hypothetical protein
MVMTHIAVVARRLPSPHNPEAGRKSRIRFANQGSGVQIKDPGCKSRIRIEQSRIRRANRGSALNSHKSAVQIEDPDCKSRIRRANRTSALQATFFLFWEKTSLPKLNACG